MTVEIQNNKDDSNLIQYVIDIRKQERHLMKKGSTYSKFRNKMRRVCEEDDCYLDGDCPFNRARIQGEKGKTFSLQVIILYSKENYFMRCKGYGEN